MSSFTHSHQVFLPLSLVPPISISLHDFTQSASSFLSKCPNHLSLPRLTTSDTLSIFNRFLRSSFGILSLNVTPHILLTIIISDLSSLRISSTLTGHVSLPYTITL